jgi:hypothetical protein
LLAIKIEFFIAEVCGDDAGGNARAFLLISFDLFTCFKVFLNCSKVIFGVDDFLSSSSCLRFRKNKEQNYGKNFGKYLAS